MRAAGIVGASVLGLILGTTAPASAQHGNDDKRHADSHQQGNDHQKEHGRSSREKDRDKNRDREQHSDRHQANDREQRHEPEHVREANRSGHDQHSRPRDVWQDHRAKNWKHEHRGWRERGGYRGYRIPDDRFHANFGRGHWFRVRSNPIIVVNGYPRFQYGGFWFSVVDPWPEYWSRTWYETDDVYVDYVNDGYYMYNRRHPGIGIAINVSF